MEINSSIIRLLASRIILSFLDWVEWLPVCCITQWQIMSKKEYCTDIGLPYNGLRVNYRQNTEFKTKQPMKLMLLLSLISLEWYDLVSENYLMTSEEHCCLLLIKTKNTNTYSVWRELTLYKNWILIDDKCLLFSVLQERQKIWQGDFDFSWLWQQLLICESCLWICK